MEKKAMALPENVTELLIGIFAFLFLAGLIWILAVSVFTPSEPQNAKKTIDILEAKINYLAEGQNGSFPIQGFKTENGWAIVGWGKNDINRPDKCFFKSCICICPDYKSSIWNPLAPDITTYMKNSCQESGTCRLFEVEYLSTKTIYKNSLTGTGNPPWIHLRQNMIEIKVSKQKNNITLIYEDINENIR